MIDNIKEFKMQRSNLLAIYSCIRLIIEASNDEKNDLFISNADIGLLMECMTEVAKNDKDTNKELTVKLGFKFIEPIWHCLNMVIQNKLHKDQNHFTDICQIIEKFAVVLDAEKTMAVSPLKLV